MSANRMHFPNTVHFVTNRTENEMFLLKPTENITKIIQGWFARALCKEGKGLEIYAFIFLSNHFHLLVKDTQGTLASFMNYFEANVAKAINRELGRRGSFWSREYDDVIVDGDDAFWNRYAYTVGNAVKAGLVSAVHRCAFTPKIASFGPLSLPRRCGFEAASKPNHRTGPRPLVNISTSTRPV